MKTAAHPRTSLIPAGKGRHKCRSDRQAGREVSQAVAALAAVCFVPDAGLDESTSPAAVARDQRRAVESVHEPGMPVERVVDLVCLPPDVVRRRLAEIAAGADR